MLENSPVDKYPGSRVSVAFILTVDAKQWQGGLNYYRSLFQVIHEFADDLIEPVIFTGSSQTVVDLELNFPIRSFVSPVFRSRSLPWVLNEFLYRVFGKPLLATREVLNSGIQIQSHCRPSCNHRLKSIAWIPDFQHLHLPGFFPKNKIRSRNKIFNYLLKMSDLVVLSSESAASDLRRFNQEYSYKARILRFTAIAPKSEAIDPIHVFREYGIQDAYFYIPNQFWAHKNHVVAVRALAIVAKSYPDLQVVCSGSLNDYRNPSHVSNLRALIQSLDLENNFLLLGMIPYPYIPILMANSVALINPSLFEGWSTTVEEAKAIGAPMLLSDIDVHREQCASGEAVFFDPMDAESLARRMEVSLADVNSRLDGDRRFESAIVTHQQRSKEFALRYASIVGELIKRTA
jgi:glycosyltransferase involved in cell wall biosynthesis